MGWHSILKVFPVRRLKLFFISVKKKKRKSESERDEKNKRMKVKVRMGIKKKMSSGKMSGTRII